MPINRTHAFGEGATFPLSPETSYRSKRPLWRRLIIRMWRIIEQEQARTAAESFFNGAVFGPDCRIGAHAWCVNAGPKDYIQLGSRVICRGILRSESFHPGRIVIGDEVYIGDDCILSCAERIEIGRFTLLAHGVQIFDNNSHPVDPFQREHDYKVVLGKEPGPRSPIDREPIVIGERVWLGFNAFITRGIRIGSGSIVAAGSVVTSDVPDYTIVAGNPAKIVKELASPEMFSEQESGEKQVSE